MRPASSFLVQAAHRCQLRDEAGLLLQHCGLRAVAALAGRPFSHAALADDVGAPSTRALNESIGPECTGDGGGGGRPARTAAPYRLRACDREFDSHIVAFAERLFQSNLDDDADDGVADDKGTGVVAAEAAAGAEREPPLSGDAAAAAMEQVEAASSSGSDAAHAVAAAAAYASTEKQRKRRQLRLTGGGKLLRHYDGWLALYAKAAARLRSVAGGLGVQQADPLLLIIHRQHAEYLLAPIVSDDDADATAAATSDDADPSTSSSSSSGGGVRLQVEAALERVAALARSLGLPPSAAVPVLLRKCPQLLLQQPDEAALAALERVMGGTRALLAGAVLATPGLLLLSPDSVQRRFEVLGLHLLGAQTVRRGDADGTAALVRLVSSQPRLLAVSEPLINSNARFLGSLMPLRPYRSLLARFPELLAGNLQRTLGALQRRAPAELAALDLELVACQQPTLLLAPTSRTLSAWHRVRQSCARVPAWEAELGGLLAFLQQEQAEQQQRRVDDGGGNGASAAEQAAEAAAEEAAAAEEEAYQPPPSRPDGDGGAPPIAFIVGSGGGGGRGSPPPWWFYQDDEGVAAAAVHGAFGSRSRPWSDDCRLAARQLARLLDARRWQLQRLEFLAEAEAEAEAGGWQQQQHGQQQRQQRQDQEFREVPGEEGEQQQQQAEQWSQHDRAALLLPPLPGLLHAVMMPRADFAERYPAFPGWLVQRQQEEAEAQDERRRLKKLGDEAAAAAAAAAPAGEERGSGGVAEAPLELVQVQPPQIV